MIQRFIHERPHLARFDDSRRDSSSVSAPLQSHNRDSVMEKVSDRSGRTQPKQQYVDLAARVEELERVNRTLAERVQELQEFVHLAARDLHDPLQKLRSFSSLMQDEYGNHLDDVGRYYMERMQASAVRMSRVASDLLEYSRITADGEPFEDVDFCRLTRRLALAYELELEEAGGRIIQRDLPRVHGNARQLERMMECLIDNAIRFRSGDASLVIEVAGSVAADGRTAIITVRDNGIGFNDCDRERVFMPFHRLDRKADDPGCGVGLAVARHIARRHGGDLVATSAPQAGSVFTITLPTT